ncbi:hypothetical protein Pint_06265 [Pistacia integerrima]|uniref:Uncharacterized protein n=1 Tax=Pistacia integerrima TaxID=434235 RepID=A0ACC0Z8F2_9ROSI|nr:hypothetical protein Pint_06265 [Pistacia integerrima]
MSSEYVAFGEIDTSLDIWCLGCMVMEMFTRRTAMRWTNEKFVIYELVEVKKTPIILENMLDKGKVFLMKCFFTNPMERSGQQRSYWSTFYC